MFVSFATVIMGIPFHKLARSLFVRNYDIIMMIN